MKNVSNLLRHPFIVISINTALIVAIFSLIYALLNTVVVDKTLLVLSVIIVACIIFFFRIRYLATQIFIDTAFPPPIVENSEVHQEFNESIALSPTPPGDELQPVDIAVPHFRRYSYFSTTDRNLLLYWFANLIIYPVYGACVILLLYYGLASEDNIYTELAIQAGILLTFSIPIISTFYLQRHWHQGFTRREILVIASFSLYFLLISRAPDDTAIGFINLSVFITSVLWIIFTTIQICNHWLLRIPILLVIAIIFIVAVFNNNPQIATSLNNEISKVVGSPITIFNVNHIQSSDSIVNQLTDGVKSAIFDLATILNNEISEVTGNPVTIFDVGHVSVSQPTIEDENYRLIADLATLSISAWRGLGGLAVAYSVWRLIQYLNWYRNLYPRYGRKRYIAIYLIAILIAFSLELITTFDNEHMWLRMAMGIVVLLVSADPFFIFSRQVAGLRNATRHTRHDILTALVSPVHGLENPINIILNQLGEFTRLSNRRLYVSLALLVGGLIIPVSYYISTITLNSPTDKSNDNFIQILLGSTSKETFNIPVPSILELMAVGIVGSTVLVGLYLTLWLINNRSSYIVSRFAVTPTPSEASPEPELTAIANLATHILVEELQKIAAILRVRQVEDVRFSQNERSSFFVTSGNDQDFIKEMQQIVNIEAPSPGNINLGKFLSLAIKALAKIQVEGRVQRRSNSSVEIWVQLAYSGNHAVAVDQVIVPENSIQEIDEKSIRPIARQIAIKLYIAMGQVGHLGTSVESLDALLIGMESVAKNDWWHAIMHYRKALEYEETIRRSFGIGHYHLGAALSYQGDWFDGLEHLRTAEVDGPPLAELQYMIALLLLNIYWAKLYDNPSIFLEIRQRLENALQLRPTFAEAHQLLGTAHYRRGRLHERATTAGYKKVEIVKNYQHHFWRSHYHFRQALRLYDREERKNNNSINRYVYHEVSNKNLLQQRITVAHQLGDTLRVLELYAEADTYYRDMMAVYPRNLRNLTDLAKIYCLSGNWQAAEEFMWQTVFNDDVAYWDADVCIHMGWALLGGIDDSLSTPVKRLVDFLARRLYGNEVDDAFIKENIGRLFNYYKEPQRTLHIFTSAMQYIDYAIHQRPRYITYYAQTDWWNPLQRTVNKIGQLVKPSIQDQWNNNIANHIDQIPPAKYVYENMKEIPIIRLKHYQVWLGLRLYSFGIYADIFEDDKQINLGRLSYKAVALEFLDYARQHAPRFYNLYRDFYQLRNETIEFYVEAKVDRRAAGLWMTYKRLKLANKFLKRWSEFLLTSEYQQFMEQMKNKSHPDFFDRWKIEVISEFAMLTCRMLAEGRAFEQVYQVASIASTTLIKWTKWWEDTYKDEGKPYNSFTYSPRVTRYQHASLLAWRSLALYQCYFDQTTKARCDFYIEQGTISSLEVLEILDGKNKEQLLNQVQSYLHSARRHIQNHPLTNFVQALVYYRRELYDKAIDELEHLLDIVRPYDPKQPFSSDVFNPNTENEFAPDAPSQSRRSRMYYMERISGRQQFYDLINNPRIHFRISEIYRDMGEPELRVQHLMEAIRQSNYDDLDMDNFIRIGNALNNMERYDDALSVMQAVKYPMQRMGNKQLSDSKRELVKILQTTIVTRSNKHAEALTMARDIAANYKFPAQHWTYMEMFNLEFNQFMQQAKEDVINTTHIDFTDVINQVKSRIFIPEDTVPDGLEYVSSLTGLIEAYVEKFYKTTYKTQYSNSLEIKISNLFNSITDITTIDELAKQALIVLDPKYLQQAIKQSQQNSISSDSDRQEKFDETLKLAMTSQMIDFHSREASNTLAQLAELSNALAYNRAETGVYMQYGIHDSTVAFVLMSYLMYTSRLGTTYRDEFMSKQAQFCDTFGWVRYREFMNRYFKSFPEYEGDDVKIKSHDELKIVEEFLKRGTRYDPKRAIIHYHLARLYLSYVELIWQQTPDIHENKNLKEASSKIDSYQLMAFRKWRSAQKFDRFGRLHARLSWLYNRINTMKRYWEIRQIRTLSGDDNLELPPTVGGGDRG